MWTTIPHPGIHNRIHIYIGSLRFKSMVMLDVWFCFWRSDRWITRQRSPNLKITQNIDQNNWAKMHVVVPQNLPISVQGFFEDSSSLASVLFSWDFSIFQRKHKPNFDKLLMAPYCKWTKSMPPYGEMTQNLQPEIQQSNKLKAL